MSPVNIMYLILVITAILLFVIFKYVKEPYAQDSTFDTNQHSPNTSSHEILEEKKEPIDFKELNFQSNYQNLSEDEYQEFVNQYNLNLPKLYKDIMLTSNGGEPNELYYKDSPASFTPIKYGPFTINDILRLSAEHFLPHGFFPFIDHGEYGYAISMNADSLHQIYFWDETGEFEYECDSLQDFLNELDEGEIY